MHANTAGLDALDAAVTDLAAVDVSAQSVADRLHALDRLETTRRRQIAVFHTIVDSLQRDRLPLVHKAVADVTRISLSEARRRVRNAEQLAPRSTLIGEPLPPALPATATAWQAGILGEEHLAVIQKFLRDLPGHIAPDAVARSELFLAEQAAHLRPDQLEKVATQLTIRLNPDGNFTDDDRARVRGFTWCGGQRPDGTSVARLIATPQLRAELEAWFAKFAAPGMSNPADESPTLSDPPSDGGTHPSAQRDTRSSAQRRHDALSALVRGQLGDPKLGTHNGLPVTVIATVSIQDLQSSTGHAVTAGGTQLPVTELIRMAAHANHYLTLFDGVTGQPLWLGRTKRVASADQRIVLHAIDRGCSHPGCDMPGVSLRSPSRRRLGQWWRHQHRQSHLRLSRPPQADRPGLANEKALRRADPMDPAAPTAITRRHQRLSPPRTPPPRLGRRRRITSDFCGAHSGSRQPLVCHC